MADPPCCVRGELEAFTPVELFDRVHKAKVAFLNEVEQRKTRCLVLLGDGDHKAKVGLNESALGNFAFADGFAQFAALGGRKGFGLFHLGGSDLARFNCLCQADFVIFGEKCVLADVCEIEPDEVFFVAVNPVLCHS